MWGENKIVINSIKWVACKQVAQADRCSVLRFVVAANVNVFDLFIVWNTRRTVTRNYHVTSQPIFDCFVVRWFINSSSRWLIPSNFTLRFVCQFDLLNYYLDSYVKSEIKWNFQRSFYKFESLFTLFPFAMLCFRFEIFTINFDFTFRTWIELSAQTFSTFLSLVSNSNDIYLIVIMLRSLKCL